MESEAQGCDCRSELSSSQRVPCKVDTLRVLQEERTAAIEASVSNLAQKRDGLCVRRQFSEPC